MKLLKTPIFLVILSLVFGLSAKAQKFGYIDTEYITSKMPAYKTTLAEMDKWTEKWTKEIADKYGEIETMERQFRSEEPLLTDAMKQDRQKLIKEKELALRELQNKVFGYNGQHYQKQKEIIKPLIDQIAKATEKVARQKQLMMLFDKASEGMSMIYTDPRHDYTDYVLEELGIDTDGDSEKETPKEGNTKTQNKPPTKNPK
jgi:outer membrane protein